MNEEQLQDEIKCLREGLQEIRRLKRSIRDGGLCDTGSPYLEGRLRAFQEAAKIADQTLKMAKR